MSNKHTNKQDLTDKTTLDDVAIRQDIESFLDAALGTAGDAVADARELRDVDRATVVSSITSDFVQDAERHAVNGAAGAVGGHAMRRALDAEIVLETIKRVASKQAKTLTDEQLLAKLAEPGFRRAVSGHLFEALDEQAVNSLHKLTRGATPLMRRFAAHNEIGLDAEYVAGKLADGVRYAQHKLTRDPKQLASAVTKLPEHAKGVTELVVARGERGAAELVTGGTMKVRESAAGFKDVDRALRSAEKVKQAGEVGVIGGMGAAAKKAPGGAALSAGISVASDLNRRRKGEDITHGEIAENAAWAAGEAAVSAVAGAGAAAAAAPVIAAGGAALAGSAVGGTTAAGALLLAAGPVGVTVVAGVGAGAAVKAVRRRLRRS